MTTARRQDLAAIISKYGITVIEDEVTRPVLADSPPAMKELVPDLCYLLASPSKTLCPGLRVGFALPPDSSRQRLLDTLRATLSYPGGLPVTVLGQMIDDGTAKKIQFEVRREARSRQAIAAEILKSNSVRTNPHSYFAWLKLPETWSASAFATEATRPALPVIPAEAFATDIRRAASAVRLTTGAAQNQAVLSDSLHRLNELLDKGPRSWLEES